MIVYREIIVFKMGINPGLYSAYLGHHYCNANNHFCERNPMNNSLVFSLCSSPQGRVYLSLG